MLFSVFSFIVSTLRGLYAASAVGATGFILPHLIPMPEGYLLSYPCLIGLTVFAEFFAGVLFGRIIGEKKAREADLKRMENLEDLPQATSFLYGEEAGDKIKKEYFQLTKEQGKHTLDNLVRKAGYEVPKECVQKTYDSYRKGNITELNAYLEKHREIQVPFPVMIKALALATTTGR